MDKKQMFVQVVNLETGKIFSLPTLYTDRTEACVCGQNYIRDRQAEDPCSELFFRVLFVDSMWDNNEDENDCEGECERCGLCCEDESEYELDEDPLLEEAKIEWKNFAKRFPESSPSRIFFEQLI